MSVRNLIVVSVMSILLAWGMELSGLSIELGYKFIGILLTMPALMLLFWGWRGVRSGHPAVARLSIVFCLLLLATGWGMQMLNTSPRKHFYLLAHKTKSGESIDAVKARFQGYRSWSGEGYITFSANPPLGVNDVVIVSYDPNSKRVIRANFSAD